MFLTASNGQLLPHLKMPLYLWCRAFDKMYDWYSGDSTCAELNTFLPQHIMQKLNRMRYEHARNPRKQVGSVGWDEWAHDMQATHFDEADTVLEHLNMLYPCAECGNMDALESVHGGKWH